MRLELAVGVVSLFTLLNATEAVATIHLTDVRGGEVTINRGPRLPAVQPLARKPRQVGVTAVTITAGPDVDAANNDYRRIQNALDAAIPGDTILLSGTFDFTAPFAAAAWALGDDNTAGTADDYSVYIPGGKNNVTLTATSLGSATVQGPGDLAALDLEGFLFFDGGDNQGWTISNLRILDFDLSIGMFASGVNAFSNTVIQNNFIRIPTDLNDTVAPADAIQNIGINFSFGTNQSILGNTFNVPGDGVSNGANTAATVVMQSNTSGGSVYNGLTIVNNVVHVLNAQSANPEVIIGIWDNGHAHTSNISITNNQFLNDAAGNDPALNTQRAFRVTSHSGAASTVTYGSNQAAGANIGFQWIAAANFAGNQAVVLSGNTITNCATGVLVQSNGVANFIQDVITGSGAGGGIHVATGTLTGSGANSNSIFRSVVSGGSGDGVWIETTAGAIAPMSQNDLSVNSGFGLRNESAPAIVAEVNWWGSNLAALVAAEVSGNADFDPWLASGTDVSPLFAFQPFTYATTSGTLTTFAGTGAADTGALLAGNPITMMMDGDTAFTPTAELLSFDIQLGGSDDVFTLGQTGIPTLFDGGTGNDTLVGTNVAQSWNITGAGSGNIPGATSSFTGVESLRGGTAADSFVFGAGGSIPLTVDGNLGTDSLNNSAIPGATITPTGPGTLDGFMGTATGIGSGFDNINLVAAAAELSVVKSGPATATAGTVISYTITVMNAGPNAAINAQLTDPLPAGTTFSSLTSPGGWSCTTPAVNGSGTVTCTIPSMAVGAAVFTLNVNAPAAIATVTNTATVSSASSDSNPADNSSTSSTNVVFVADLSITKTPAPGPYGTNAALTYTLAVTNGGPSPATNTVVTDILPAGTTFSSATPSQGSCSGTTTMTCSLGTLNSGATATILLTVALPSTAGPVVNTATVTTASSDPNPANNAATSTITVVSSPNIPTSSPLTLLLIALGLAMIGAIVKR